MLDIPAPQLGRTLSTRARSSTARPLSRKLAVDGTDGRLAWYEGRLAATVPELARGSSTRTRAGVHRGAPKEASRRARPRHGATRQEGQSARGAASTIRCAP